MDFPPPESHKDNSRYTILKGFVLRNSPYGVIILREPFSNGSFPIFEQNLDSRNSWDASGKQNSPCCWNYGAQAQAIHWSEELIESLCRRPLKRCDGEGGKSQMLQIKVPCWGT